MRKLIAILLLATGMPLAAQSQTLTEDTTATLTTKPPKNLFVKARDALIKYLDYYDFDTAYIRPTQYKYTIMMQHSASFEHYAIKCVGEKAQKLSISPNQSYKLGVYFGWHSLFLGLSVNTTDLFSKRHGSNKKTEYYFNLYGYKLGGDLFYKTSGNNFKIRDAEGFFDNDKQYNFRNRDFNGIRVKKFGFNVYYVFNNNHFSYPAAYSQTTVQKISRGTLVAGLSWSRHNFEFDYRQLPTEIQDHMYDELKFDQIHYTDFNVNFGYAFNWVFADNWLAAVALTPAIAYKISHIKAEKSLYNEDYHNFNFDFITRAGIVYNNNKFFAGASTVGHVYQYYLKNFSLIDNFGVVNLYVGFNFGPR